VWRQAIDALPATQKDRSAFMDVYNSVVSNVADLEEAYYEEQVKGQGEQLRNPSLVYAKLTASALNLLDNHVPLVYLLLHDVFECNGTKLDDQ
jgi:hypothetical protein